MRGVSAAHADRIINEMKMMGQLTGVKVVKEDRAPDGSATLTVEAMDADKKKTSGKVIIMKEGGDWKLGKESWSS